MMLDDPIVAEMRKNGQDFTARYNNNLAAICKALKEKEQTTGREVVYRASRLLPHRPTRMSRTRG
jgi:hypothetical protein